MHRLQLIKERRNYDDEIVELKRSIFSIFCSFNWTDWGNYISELPEFTLK